MVDDAAQGPQAYWTSTVSRIEDGRVLIRGYDLEELIGGQSFTASTFLLLRGRLPTPARGAAPSTPCSTPSSTTRSRSRARSPPATPSRPTRAWWPAWPRPSWPSASTRSPPRTRPGSSSTRTPGWWRRGRRPKSRDHAGRRGTGATRAHPRLRPSPLPPHRSAGAAPARDRRGRAGCGATGPASTSAVHRAFTALPGKADIPINDVGMMAVVLVELGFTPEETTGLAVLSTMPGVIAHISEELRTGRPIRVVPEAMVDYGDARRARLRHRSEERRMAGRVVAVTGAGSGIGRAVAPGLPRTGRRRARERRVAGPPGRDRGRARTARRAAHPRRRRHRLRRGPGLHRGRRRGGRRPLACS